MEGTRVPIGVGKWGHRGAHGDGGDESLGAPGSGEMEGPRVPVFMGDRLGGAHVHRCMGAAPTLDGEGGPVLRLPAWGAGPAHVHPLCPPRQLRYPAGTQSRCETPRGEQVWGGSHCPISHSLPQHPVPHAVGGG